MPDHHEILLLTQCSHPVSFPLSPALQRSFLSFGLVLLGFFFSLVRKRQPHNTWERRSSGEQGRQAAQGQQQHQLCYGMLGYVCLSSLLFLFLFGVCCVLCVQRRTECRQMKAPDGHALTCRSPAVPPPSSLPNRPRLRGEARVRTIALRVSEFNGYLMSDIRPQRARHSHCSAIPLPSLNPKLRSVRNTTVWVSS
jgi:hypothetical protein